MTKGKKNKPRDSGVKKRRKVPSEKAGGSAWMKKMSAMLHEKLQTIHLKKVIMMNIPYIICFYVVEKEAWLYRHCIGGECGKETGEFYF